MTFKWEKTKDGFIYKLQDDFVLRLHLISPIELYPDEVDTLTSEALKIGSENGILSTPKGNIEYIINYKKWETDNKK